MCTHVHMHVNVHLSSSSPCINCQQHKQQANEQASTACGWRALLSHACMMRSGKVQAHARTGAMMRVHVDRTVARTCARECTARALCTFTTKCTLQHFAREERVHFRALARESAWCTLRTFEKCKVHFCTCQKCTSRTQTKKFQVALGTLMRKVCKCTQKVQFWSSDAAIFSLQCKASMPEFCCLLELRAWRACLNCFSLLLARLLLVGRNVNLRAGACK